MTPPALQSIAEKPISAPLSANASPRPSREEAMEAVRTLLAWTGDDPRREGLLDTPRRVVDAYRDWFKGYDADPAQILARTFEDMSGYSDMVVLRDIEVNSHCEHHIAPFIGRAWVAYMPGERVVGISKIVKLVDAFARRLQSQEALTAQIADAMETHLAPRGVAIMMDAEHMCMTTRGVAQRGVGTLTSHYSGVFQTDAALQERFSRLASEGLARSVGR